MSVFLRLILVLLAWVAVRGAWRSWRLRGAREQERRRAAASARYHNLSDQEVSDADFEEIPQAK